jgi:hypothetical protein
VLTYAIFHHPSKQTNMEKFHHLHPSETIHSKMCMVLARVIFLATELWIVCHMQELCVV